MICIKIVSAIFFSIKTLSTRPWLGVVKVCSIPSHMCGAYRSDDTATHLEPVSKKIWSCDITYLPPTNVYYVNSEHYCKMRYHFGQIRPKQGVQFQFFPPINLRFSVSCLCCMYKASCHISRGGNTYIVFTYLKQFQFCTN